MLPREGLEIFASLAYGVLLARNKICFEQQEPTTDSFIAQSLSVLASYHSAFWSIETSSVTSPTIMTIKSWPPPLNGAYKLNTDIAQRGDVGWGFEAIFRDGEGNILATTTKMVDLKMEPQLAEIMCMSWGIGLAHELCFWDLEIESNCTELIQALKCPTLDSTFVDLHVSECLSCLYDFRSFSFHHIGRNGNKVAHELARIANNSSDMIWIEEAPQTICNLSVFDILACPAQ